jgi:hypothetical protein
MNLLWVGVFYLGGFVKKLLLFLALSVGSADAMQSDIMQWDAAGTIPV